MRTAEICPTCAVYQNAECIIYNGPYLPNAVVNPGDNLENILGSIDKNLVPKTGTGSPNSPATYVGQLYVDSNTSMVYYASNAGTANDFDQLLTAPIAGVPEYANNAAALFSGLVAGQLYRTSDILKIVH
jgi:hypothetical protein|uniref:Uncharacterized protein n=1 Tax=Virus NIOZ-UU157 TaxID=2763269 RepID=A0A7S9SU89_9VIRU|nr:MAG: hypothetical protein NIOZUU157_00355 [Virus NIOZ-UU157]|tara:strand:+ start:1150 stop:1539 length:390 start_codon:yes stop_codon:yes gene_type:complete